MTMPEVSAAKLREFAKANNQSVGDVHREIVTLVSQANLGRKLKPSYTTISAHLSGRAKPTSTYMMLYKMLWNLDSLEDLYDQAN